MSLDALLEPLVVALVPAVGGLLTLVVQHGRAIAAIQSQIEAQAKAQEPAMLQIQQDLRMLNITVAGMAVATERVHGEIKALRERTDELLRTTARHEAFLFRTDSDARATS